MPAATDRYPLNFDPNKLPRERMPHYISASEQDIKEMLKVVGVESLEDLYSHIPKSCRFDQKPALPEETNYDELFEKMAHYAEKNANGLSFIADSLPVYSVKDIVAYVSENRKLATAYTPYQPERSQGTLYTHWIYQCLMSQLTGFEAISSSLYDRSTALYEAICTSIRLSRKADSVIIPESIFPGDLEVIETLAKETGIHIVRTRLNAEVGRTSLSHIKAEAEKLGDRLAAVVFPQVNCLGILEEVDVFANNIKKLGARSICIIDPALLAAGGLKAPSDYGDEGVDIIVGDAQHLAIGPNFGGPGLGLFAIRHNDKRKNDIRQTPGRFTGKAFDTNGRECRVMVLSTREQHIRKDKATSNICSNQGFIATLAGASLLSRGESGMKEMIQTARSNALLAADRLTSIPGIELAYKNTPFFNEILLRLDSSVSELLEKLRQKNIQAGINVSERVEGAKNLLKIAFSDIHSEENVLTLASAIEEAIGQKASKSQIEAYEIPEELLRAQGPDLPEFEEDSIRQWYDELGELNVSPDDAPYPLGSCTMKYNPYINEWAAGLPGITDIHPQAPIEDSQGALEILFEIQEWIKGITGLPAVTTQPVAGAQGELVGVKLFQAYFRDRGEVQRDVILVPKSAHGTNFATATMAGYINKVVDGKKVGLVLLEADTVGKVDMADLDNKIAQYGNRIAGIMITNPNTSGLFETSFKEIADKIHNIGGLVYMDGANTNAIAGWIDLGKMGVDAVHHNLHKTWSIPHGGGGPGDGIVAVSEKLMDFLPGHQIIKMGGSFKPIKAAKSIGSFHRNWGNFSHKVRALSYLSRLGKEGVPRMSAMAVLSARYLYERLKKNYPSLPEGSESEPRMHEFILSLTEEDFKAAEETGTPKASVLARVGKLFLDFGFHAPTMSWPEVMGMMIEPTESYTKAELDRFADAVLAISEIIKEKPEILTQVPYFTPVDRVDEVAANRNLCLSEKITELPKVESNRVSLKEINQLDIQSIKEKILAKIQKA